ncbi:hypothetical protein BOX15_Mlig007349g1, partial [Macrostomum lignano]
DSSRHPAPSGARRLASQHQRTPLTPPPPTPPPPHSVTLVESGPHRDRVSCAKSPARVTRHPPMTAGASTAASRAKRASSFSDTSASSVDDHRQLPHQQHQPDDSTSLISTELTLRCLWAQARHAAAVARRDLASARANLLAEADAALAELRDLRADLLRRRREAEAWRCAVAADATLASLESAAESMPPAGQFVAAADAARAAAVAARRIRAPADCDVDGLSVDDLVGELRRLSAGLARAPLNSTWPDELLDNAAGVADDQRLAGECARLLAEAWPLCRRRLAEANGLAARAACDRLSAAVLLH